MQPNTPDKNWLGAMDCVCFVQDIYPQNTLYAVTIRSPIASGRLISINCPTLPSSCTLIAAKDIPGENRLEGTGIPVFATDRLSYIGEPVALLLGPDKIKLEEYFFKCEVLAEEEEPFFSYSRSGAGNDDSISEDRIFAARNIKIGQPEDAFARAARIIQNDYHTGIQEHWYTESTGAVCWYEENDPSGTLVVRTASQQPNHVKNSLLLALGIAPDALKIKPTLTEQHMDGKLWYPSLIACHCALGTLITKKPVRLILNREEDFLFPPKRCQASIKISSALDNENNIIGVQINAIVNLGAFGVNVDKILDQVCLGSIGAYNFENLELNARAVKTNIPPGGPFCGFGISQGLFAMERNVSCIADNIKIDPSAWRKNNLKPNLFLPALNITLKEAAPFTQLINITSSMSDYWRKWASYELLRKNRAKGDENLRGIGIAIGYQENALPSDDAGDFNMEVTLTKDGLLEIKSGLAGHILTGQDDGLGHLWANIAAEILSIKPQSVRQISAGDAASGVHGFDHCCSYGNSVALTALLEDSCHKLGKQRFREPLPITVCNSIKTQGKLPGCGWVASVVEIEVSPAQYIPKIRGIWLCIDGGKIYSMGHAKKSLEINTAAALGWAFMEHLNYDNGAITKEQYNNYTIPRPDDIPPVNIEFINTGSKKAKNIGELPFTCIPAAYLQAVSQAMNHHFCSIPLKKEDIQTAINFMEQANANRGYHEH